MNPCPSCKKDLTVFYSLTRQLAVVHCDNSQCVMNHRQIEGTGDRTKEALEHFQGVYVLKFERSQRC